VRYADNIDGVCVIDLRNVERPPPEAIPGLDFEAASQAWRSSVLVYGKARGDEYTTRASTGTRCPVPVYACTCLVCTRKRVSDPEKYQ